MSYLWTLIKRNMIAGLLVVVPFIATAWLLRTLWDFIDKPLNNFFRLFTNPDTPDTSEWMRAAVLWCKENVVDLGILSQIPGLAVVITLGSILVVGFIARTLAGRFIIRMGEKIVDRVPIIGKLYGGVKQLLEAVFSKSHKAFREAVLIQYPRKGLWSIAFITHRIPHSLTTPSATANTDSESAPPLPTVDTVFAFVPTTPNPTSGVLVAVPLSEMTPLNMTVDEAIKLVISAGMILPPERKSNSQSTPDISALDETKESVP